MLDAAHLEGLTAEQLREVVDTLLAQARGHDEAVQRRDEEIRRKDAEIRLKDAKIGQLTAEMALLRRWKFGRSSERLQADQAKLFDEECDADAQAIEMELEKLAPSTKGEPRNQPKRQKLPEHLPRIEIRHEPENGSCGCGCELKRIGEDVAEKLDYTPGVFTVERHIRGKWACPKCEHIVMAPVPAQVIDKGIPTAGTLAQVLIAKYADHLPLYRQEAIFARAGLAIARSTLAQWVGACGVQLQPLAEALKAVMLQSGVLHADETPVATLAPGTGKTHRSYLWAYATSRLDPLKAVLYEFAPSRSGQHARQWLGDWRGTLVVDEFQGYKALFEQGVTEAGCLAHARRKFHDLHVANQSQIAATALRWFQAIYRVESELAEVDAQTRSRTRQRKSRRLFDHFHRWLMGRRRQVPNGTATAKAIDYSLRRWQALTRHLGDAAIPIDNNWIENQIRPWAIGRSNWLFAGSQRAGTRAATIMSLIQSAKMNGHDPYVYLRDVLERLPAHPANRIDELLPHRWAPDRAAT